MRDGLGSFVTCLGRVSFSEVLQEAEGSPEDVGRNLAPVRGAGEGPIPGGVGEDDPVAASGALGASGLAEGLLEVLPGFR